MAAERISSLFDMKAIKNEIKEVEASLDSVKKQSGFVVLTEKKVVLYGALVFITGFVIGLLW